MPACGRRRRRWRSEPRVCYVVVVGLASLRCAPACTPHGAEAQSAARLAQNCAPACMQGSGAAACASWSGCGCMRWWRKRCDWPVPS
jgi:hypothetical protein